MAILAKITPSLSVGDGQKFLLIAGPCQIESKDHCLKIASFLKTLADELKINLVFKSSFDKANRTSISGKRGIGIDQGLKILESVRKDVGIPVLTDVHSIEQVRPIAQVVDVIQIPAFLCRQTDLLCAVGETNRAVNVKKGQFLAPHDMRFAAEKIGASGNRNILLCERGACFGYRDLVVDMRSLLIMRSLGYPVIFDSTHSVQSMGGAGGASGGQREFVAPLSRAAMAVGVDGIFLECHDNPEVAPSDGASMLRLEEVKPILVSLLKIREALSA